MARARLKNGGNEEKPNGVDAMHITDQFRHKGSMMYEFREGAVRLTIRMQECPAGWEMEAIPKHPIGLDPVVAEGPGRREALQALSESWLSSSILPRIDWPAIGKALTAVKAI